MITTAIVTPTIMPMDEELWDEELVGDGVGCSVTITQSGELNESSIAGQLGSTSRVTAATDIDGEDCIQLVILLTTSSAIGPWIVTLALNTTVSSNPSLDPRQLKLSSTILKAQEHLSVISCITVDNMSLSFWLGLSICNMYTSNDVAYILITKCSHVLIKAFRRHFCHNYNKHLD